MLIYILKLSNVFIVCLLLFFHRGIELGIDKHGMSTTKFLLIPIILPPLHISR